MSRIAFSAGFLKVIDFCLIFVPYGHYDEPEILPYPVNSIRPIVADGGHRVAVESNGFSNMLGSSRI